MAPAKKRARLMDIKEGTPEIDARPSGRPSRKSAGRISLPSGYVNSANVDGFDDSSEYEEEKPPIRKWKQKPLEPTRPLSPMHYEEFASSSRGSSTEPHQFVKQEQEMMETVTENVSLTFNVPKNHSGPFVVHLNLRDLAIPSHAGYFDSKEKLNSSLSSTRKTTVNHKPSRAGFTDLPPELRNIIYDLVFDHGKVFDFNNPDFSASGQFLRTCKLVNAEAALLLYGSGTFRFGRDMNTEGHYWKKPWVEIGYRNVRRWLVAIGPLNVSYIRDLEIRLEDGSTSRLRILNPSNRWASDHSLKEDARYVHDKDLVECLKIIARYGQLRKLHLNFQSRKQLTKRDDRFVHELRKIRTDKLTEKLSDWANSYGYRGQAKIDGKLFDELRSKMERTVKLYREEAKREKKDKKVKKSNSAPSSDAEDA